MKLIINNDGKAGFDEWFNAEDTDKIIEALAQVGINVTKQNVDWKFKSQPILKKKERYSPIKMTPSVIHIILSNADKSNDEILAMLNIERESSYIITTKIRSLQGEYVKWLRLDDAQRYATLEEKIRAFAEYYQSLEEKSDKEIEKNIVKMCKGNGCKRLSDNKFPECGNEFNSNCIKCQFNKHFIKNDVDITRYNLALENIKQ